MGRNVGPRVGSLTGLMPLHARVSRGTVCLVAAPTGRRTPKTGELGQRPRVGLRVHLAQPVNGHHGVNLSGRHRGMTQ